jgi:GTP-binding protein Era
MTDEPSVYTSGYAAIVGAPNVGKSTLLNALLGQKISIVTRKAQTTRQRVLGILTSGSSQVIFLDTPGLLEPRYRLQEKMVQAAASALQDADVILLMTEVSNGSELPREVRTHVLEKHGAKPILLLINKVDTIDRRDVLPLISAFAGMNRFREIIPLSALKGENVEECLRSLLKYLPVHPPFYPADIVSEQPERFFVAELIREAIFRQFRQEVPYATAVEIREFKEREQGKTYISADIVVERDSQKGILIGKKGESLKRVGAAARTEIELFLERPVFLDLHVRVGERWRESETWLKRLGYAAE